MQDNQNPQQPPQSPPPPPPPPPTGNAQEVPNYLVWSILVTLFCCLPFGIVGIVFSSKANSMKAQGDIAGAMEAAGKAKLWVMLGAGIGLAFTLIYVVLMVIGAVAGA